VLVYGCGEGSMVFGLPEAKSVTGVDISDVAIDRLRQRRVETKSISSSSWMRRTWTSPT